jgi:hypothetical protein
VPKPVANTVEHLWATCEKHRTRGTFRQAPIRELMFLFCSNLSSANLAQLVARWPAKIGLDFPKGDRYMRGARGVSRRQIHMESAHTGAAAGEPHGPSFPEA